MSEGGVVTFAGVAHPWMCDVMGHLNVRHYAGMFDDASFQLLGRIEGTAADAARFGWADMRLEIDFRRETAAGTLLTIRSHVEKVGGSSLVHVHVMSGTLDGTVRAQARTVSVRFDLVARSKMPLDQEIRVRAEAFLATPGSPAATESGQGA